MRNLACDHSFQVVWSWIYSALRFTDQTSSSIWYQLEPVFKCYFFKFTDEAEKEKTICGIKEAKAKIIFGIIIVLLIAVSWVGATQFAMRTYTSSFDSPYFTTWYTTVYMVVVFPLFSLPQFFKKRPWRFKTFYR